MLSFYLYLSIYLPGVSHCQVIYLSIYIPGGPHCQVRIYLSIYLSIFLEDLIARLESISIYLSIYLSRRFIDFVLSSAFLIHTHGLYFVVNISVYLAFIRTYFSAFKVSIYLSIRFVSSENAAAEDWRHPPFTRDPSSIRKKSFFSVDRYQ